MVKKRVVISLLIAVYCCGCSHHSGGITNSALTKNDQHSSVEKPIIEQTFLPLRETVEKLRLIKTDSYDTSIPPDAKPLLSALKHQLVAFIQSKFAARNEASIDCPMLKQQILGELVESGITVEEPKETVFNQNDIDEGYRYGDIYQISIEEVAKSPGLIAVTTTIGVCCGTDTSLYIFLKDNDGWKLILAQEANGYDQVSGAQGSYQYTISTQNDKDFFVVAVNVNPWCTSNWQSLRYQVLRRGQNAYEPQILLNQKHSIYLGDAPPYRLAVQGNTFSLRFHDEGYMEQLNKGEKLTLDDPRAFRVITYRIDTDKAMKLSK